MTTAKKLLSTQTGGDKLCQYYVYVYKKPDGTPFYVGKGKGDRDLDHLIKAKRVNYTELNMLKVNTIRKILNSGSEPIIERVCSDLTEDLAFELEEFLIEEIGRRDLGTGTLCNLTNGGEGQSGYMYSDERLLHQSLRYSGEGNPNYGNTGEKCVWYNKKHSEETKKKMSDSQKGRVFSEEHKQRMRKPKSEKGRSAIAQARKDSSYNPSEETKKKISDSLKGRVFSEDHSSKISSALKGKPKERVTCPHCGKEGAIGLMKRWHFDNCKAGGSINVS